MKKILIAFIILIFYQKAISQNVAINTDGSAAHTSAALDIKSTDKGMLVPRMTSSQRIAISNAATGLLVFDTDSGSFWFYTGNIWTELTGSNSKWVSVGNNIQNSNTGNVGIGAASSSYDLMISRPSPAIGFYDSSKSHFSGVIYGDSSNIYANAYRKNLLPGSVAGNIILQTNSAVSQAGNVGIGTTTPDVKLQIGSGTDVTANSGGYLQTGNSNSTNIAIDDNEIQARNNGSAAKLFVQAAGGDFQVGGTNNLIIKDGYQVYRNRPFSTNADLLPIAYGKVDAFGNILSGTGNFTAQKVSAGELRISILGESNVYVNRDNYIIIATSNYAFSPAIVYAEIETDGSFYIRSAKPWVNFTNSTCVDCSVTSSYIQNVSFWQATDVKISFIIYKI